MKIKEKSIKKFWSYVDKKSDDECWEWLGYRNARSSGTMSVNNYPTKAYKIAWMIHYGELLDGYTIYRKCRNSNCVNPKHLGIETNNERTERNFWEKVDKRSDDECWNWSACKRGMGYGALGTGKGVVDAHRFSYQIHFGEIPADLCVLHHCDNPSCVNPKHLFLGTLKDNIIDKTNKNRQLKGESVPNSKLTEEIVLSIRALKATGKYSYKEIANKLGVPVYRISPIVLRKEWKHI